MKSKAGYLSGSVSSLPTIVKLWIYRILNGLGGARRWIERYGFSNNNLAIELRFGHWLEDRDRDYDPRAVQRELDSLHRRAERKYRNARAPEPISTNVARVGRLAGLTEVDVRVLEFAILLHTEPLLEEATDTLGNLSTQHLYRCLAALLDCPLAEIRRAMSFDGALLRSGLIALDRCGSDYLRRKLNLLSDQFAEQCASIKTDPALFLEDKLIRAPAADLGVKDFRHVEQTVNVLRQYLEHAMAEHKRGVNIFLYGATGTGKTQLTRVLAQAVEGELYEVAHADSDGDSLMAYERLRAYRAAQCLLARQNTLIVFDEVEDIFECRRSWMRGIGADRHKAWMNRSLEDNAIPTFWVSNSAEYLDPAFTRRFDIVLELPVPPKRQLERILQKECEDMLSENAIGRLAEVENLAPALITRSAAVVRSIRSGFDAEAVPGILQTLLNNTLKAQGHGRIRLQDAQALPDYYDPAYTNTDTDLHSLVAGLQRSDAGRLCLYGPPGTGKTAFGRWLASQLDMPLYVHRASDLISPFLGMTEYKIARAFERAEYDKALLLIDEMDSFLQDRRNAVRSWEVTEVNEMLTQIEAFSGLFIASTNLIERLDPAAMRRFDFKLHFDYLKPEQAWQMLVGLCEALGIERPDDSLRGRIGMLRMLTPGDFAVVARRHRLQPFASAQAVLEALDEECMHKEGPRNTIGFVRG